MTNRKIKKAFERQTPDVFDAVLAECGQANDDWQVVRPPEKRRPWVGIACAAAILAFVVSLGAFVWKRPHTEAATDPTETDELIKTVTPIEKNPIEPVTDAYRGSWEGYEYAIPKINLDSRYAERINEDIRQSYVLDGDGVLREDSNRSYEYYVVGDILSLVYYLHDNIWVYTLNLSDGSEATRDEVLAQSGITIQDYLTRVAWDFANTCCTFIPQEELEAYLDAVPNGPLPVLNALWETLVRTNTDSTQPFLTDDGLCFIGDVYDLEASQRVIFRYDEPVEESTYYKDILKYAAFDECMITTAYEGTSAPGGGRIRKQSIPCVLFGSEYSQEVNQEIWELCSAYMEEDGKIRSAVDITYQNSRFSDIFSLQLMIVQEDETVTYRAYNIDINTGRKVDEADILQRFDLSQEAFDASVMRSLGNFSCSFSGEEMAQYTDTVGPDFAKSVSAENIEAAVPLILGEELYVIGTVYYSGTERMVYFQYENPAPESPYLEKMLSLYQIHLPVQPLTPVDPDKPVVEAYSKQQPYHFEDSDYIYSCSIPKIQSDSVYAQKVNRELADYYSSTFADDGTWFGANVSYDWYINGDILSLVVYLYDTEHLFYTEADLPHKIYNIRISDGSEVSTDEILQAAGVSAEDFRTRAKQILGTYYLSFLQGGRGGWADILANPEAYSDSHIVTRFGDTVSDENLDQVIAFLEKDGELRFMGCVYCMAGGFDYETPLFSYFDAFEVSPYYEDVLKLCDTSSR